MKKIGVVTFSALTSFFVIVLLTSAGTAVPYVESNSKLSIQEAHSFSHCIKSIKSVFYKKANDNINLVCDENDSVSLVRLIRGIIFPFFLTLSFFCCLPGISLILTSIFLTPFFLILSVINFILMGDFSNILNLCILYIIITYLFFIPLATGVTTARKVFNVGYYETGMTFISNWLQLFEYINFPSL